MSMSPIITAIYNKLNTTNSLKTSLSSRFYFCSAPQTTDDSSGYPYLVWHLINQTPDWDFGSSQYEDVIIQFDIVSKSSSPVEITTLVGYLESLFDFSSLTVTGYTHIKMFREMSTVDFHYEERVWVSNHRYRLLVKKN